MEILIRNSSGQPIYEQICQQLKEQILSGALGAGDALPSIRTLAKDLRISVITTKRAYDELEAEGFLVTVAGKGSFVAEKNLSLVREARLQEIEGHLQRAAELAAGCGVSPGELREMLELQLQGE
jgi:GntR family transcriptional regulator